MTDRRATVLLLQHGDREIGNAIAEGILTARAAQPRPLEPEQIEVVQAEIDRQHIVRALVRVAVGNDKTDEDYAAMTTRARGMYGEPARHGPLRRLWNKLFVGYAMLCYAIGAAYGAQRRVLERR